MSSRVEKALENHGKGYNCCQAVACAYADLVGVDENLIFAAGEGFGAGMGGMQCTCGAVSGACMVTGLLKSSRNTKEPVTKGFFRNYPLLLLYPMYLNFASSNCLPHLPYIVRFIIFNLLLVPSTNPLL